MTELDKLGQNEKRGPRWSLRFGLRPAPRTVSTILGASATPTRAKSIGNGDCLLIAGTPPGLTSIARVTPITSGVMTSIYW